jgi:hypothetical protein
MGLYVTWGKIFVKRKFRCKIAEFCTVATKLPLSVAGNTLKHEPNVLAAISGPGIGRRAPVGPGASVEGEGTQPSNRRKAG